MLDSGQQTSACGSLDAQLNGSLDFILIPDHQSASRSRLELSEKPSSRVENYLRQARNVFRKKTLYRRLPITRWLPQYSQADAFGDLIAGITVALAAIPLALAFAGIANLPTEFGLYSSFVGNFVYTAMGSCKDNILGSTAIASLLVFHEAHGDWRRAVLLTFLTGVVEVLMGLLQLSFIIDFVSGPVSAGFTSAVACIIFTSQIKNILVVQSTGSSFLQNWISMIGDIHNLRLTDTLLGVTCVAILIVLRLLGNSQIGPKDAAAKTRFHRAVNTFLWFLGVGRNALLVFVSTGLVAYLESQGKSYFRVTGFIPSGFPQVQFPQFSLPARPANATSGLPAAEATSFWDLLHDFGSCLIVIPLIGMLETIAVCKTFSNGKSVDSTQELVAVGVANIANSFFQGYRINGGLARGSVNTASGGRTPFVNVYIGGIVILAMMYLAEYFYYIPKAVLAAIIIAAVIFQLQYQVVVPMWKSKKTDLIPGFVAFVACLAFPLSLGIAIAIGINLLYILHNSARPKISVEHMQLPSGRRFLKLTPDRCLIFPSVEFVRNIVLKSGVKFSLPVVIDCTYIYGADFTAAKVIASIISDFNSRQQKIVFFNLRPSVERVFDGLNTKFTLCYNIQELEQELGGGNTSRERDKHAGPSPGDTQEVTKL